jgi:hypothetical protein
MKSLKIKIPFIITLFTMLLVLCCDNSEEINQNEDNNSNSTLMRSMSELMEQFDTNGEVYSMENPTGNMVLDFCFEFVFPIDFQMSDSSIITINSLEELIEILIQSNDDYYINDISYPFDVLVFNGGSNSIEILTIENDEIFNNLLDDCEFESDENNLCYEIYEPVCVLISGVNGEDIIIVYPNDCYAGLGGFSVEDFLDECSTDGQNYEDGFFNTDCFNLVFPINLMNSNGDEIAIGSEEALLMYIEQWYSENCDDFECDFDFEIIFPMTVEYYSENNQQLETLIINSEEELDEYIEEYCNFDEDSHEGDLFDIDCVDLVYPIDLMSSNGDVITIENEELLSDYIEQWYSENCNDFECDFDFEIVFPISIEYYSENNQQTETLVIDTEEELNDYIAEYCE